MNMAAYREAIASIESKGSGDYAALGPKTKTGDRAYGRYQVMGANIPEWTKAALGKAMTPEEFLKNPAAQDKVFDHRFGGYVKKYGPEKAARAWFGGPGAVNNPKAKDVLGTSVSTYGQKFLKSLGTLPAMETATAASPATPPVSAGGALVPVMTKPTETIAAVFDQFAAPKPPSYLTELEALQRQPSPDVAAWEQGMLNAAIDDDAERSRSQAIASFFGEPEVPNIRIPEAIDESINRYLAQLS